jgi:chromosome segregation ATPase
MTDTFILLGGGVVILWIGLAALIWIGGFDSQIRQLRQGLTDTRAEVGRQVATIRASVESAAREAKNANSDGDNLRDRIDQMKRELDQLRVTLADTQQLVRTIMERLPERDKRQR